MAQPQMPPPTTTAAASRAPLSTVHSLLVAIGPPGGTATPAGFTDTPGLVP